MPFHGSDGGYHDVSAAPHAPVPSGALPLRLPPCAAPLPVLTVFLSALPFPAQSTYSTAFQRPDDGRECPVLSRPCRCGEEIQSVSRVSRNGVVFCGIPVQPMSSGESLTEGTRQGVLF
ncbi:Uncharacterised protein [Shigella sonnei]|nr:Uncharacterised protein [Shigella sonnei]